MESSLQATTSGSVETLALSSALIVRSLPSYMMLKNGLTDAERIRASISDSHRQLIRDEANDAEMAMRPLHPQDLRQLLKTNVTLLAAHMQADRIQSFMETALTVLAPHPGAAVAKALQEAIGEVSYSSELVPYVLRRVTAYRERMEPHVEVMRKLSALAGR